MIFVEERNIIGLNLYTLCGMVDGSRKMSAAGFVGWQAAHGSCEIGWQVGCKKQLWGWLADGMSCLVQVGKPLAGGLSGVGLRRVG